MYKPSKKKTYPLVYPLERSIQLSWKILPSVVKIGQMSHLQRPTDCAFRQKKSKEITIVLILTEVTWKLVKHYKYFKKKQQLVRLAN